jgi:hypothetical protein
MGPRRKLGIYVGFQSSSIIKYLEPLTGDLFTTRFANCIFNEDHIPALEGDNKFIDDRQEIIWDDKTILSSNPYTKETNLLVQKIIELQRIGSNLQDAFTNYKGITKSFNPALNTPCRVEVPIKNTPPSKRGRVSQQKDAPNKCPRTTRKTSSSKTVNGNQPQVDNINPGPSPAVHTIEQAGGSEDHDSLILVNHDEIHGVQEILINYTSFRELFDRTTMIVNSCF